jgi:hypothetical protein
MTVVHRRSPLHTAFRCVVIGLALSAILNLVVLFMPLPDVVTEAIVALQIVGLWIEVRRATPYHLSAWNPFLINAAVYALIAGIATFVARRRRSTLSIRAV